MGLSVADADELSMEMTGVRSCRLRRLHVIGRLDGAYRPSDGVRLDLVFFRFFFVSGVAGSLLIFIFCRFVVRCGWGILRRQNQTVPIPLPLTSVP